MIYLSIVSLIWAFSFGLIGNMLSGVDSFLVATLRLGVASLLFLPFLRLKGIGWTTIVRLVLYGAIQFGLMYACYMSAFRFIPSHLVAVFSILTPVYVVFIHDLQKRVFSRRYLWIAVLSVLGAATIKAETMPTGDIWMGFLLMQVAGAAFAFGQVAYREWKIKNQDVSDLSIFGLLTIGGTLCIGCLSLPETEWEISKISADQWKAILYLGLVASGLGFFLWNKGASKTNAGTLAAFNNAVVPLAVLISLFIFNEGKNFDREDQIRLMIGSVLIGSALFLSLKRKSSSFFRI
ncbi:MAG TPA: EamA family transporter [Opitutae bacterium]|nr:EamA family transporter [Puniceicoccaceae bacterium]HCY57686.1 EamA family transporter [Opitutae bacterium]|tara:strand:+ start:2282 stop:3160 length:879 start_codon:yes stop_codon:yes gene_type:complete